MNLPPLDPLLDRPTVERSVSLSRATIYRLMAAGDFPSPVRISPNRVAWRTSEVQAWIEARRRIWASA